LKRKIAVLAVIFLTAAVLSGCSFAGLNAQTLMHAPRPTGENEADIQSLLEQTGGSGMTLKYPETGGYRSAIITHDLCGDKTQEAMAFYQKGDDSLGISVTFMQKDGEWKNIGTFSNPAAQVDRVCFGDLNGDGKDEVVVGWGSSQNNTASICVYYFQNGRMAELKLDQGYTEMAVADFSGDGQDEIFTASVTVGDQPAAAHLLRLKSGAVEVMGSAPLDTGVTQYASVKTGLVNEKQFGIVLDGVKNANNMVTELLYWDKNKKMLEAPFYDPAAKSAKSTERSTSVVSEDINGDKILEIPLVTLMPGYSGSTAGEADYLTSWHRYDTQTNTFIRVMSMVIDYADGYWFSVPDMWRGKITTKLDPATRTLTFYQWMASAGGGGGVRGPELLKIEIFTTQGWVSGKGTGGFFRLTSKDKLVFAASIPSPRNSLSLTREEIRGAFKLIDQE
jgi:hypothetical protein